MTPVRAEGRFIAVLLMIIGIIGVCTATVASFFFEQGQESDAAHLSTRLDAIEQKLNELLERNGSR